MNKGYETFVNQCIKNRKILEFSYKDMANCLINVSEEDYINFEKGTYIMSKENMIRISRVLCVEKPLCKDISEYIDVTGLSEKEIEDLAKVIAVIEGDDND